MASRGGSRDRVRRDFVSSTSNYSRFEDSNSSSNKRSSSNPPSRHLWVGNLSHSIMENDLTDHFVRFGELDSVAFQPGRSYAFINFKNDDEAIAALKALQGFPLAGNPLRIEFAKADKSSVPSRDEDYLQRRDEQRSAMKGSPFSQRDSRLRAASPEPFYADKSKVSDKSAEPSEVLWIGFPALLKVDEMILRKAFSPFGDIEKITVFPGRSYAFVRFRNVMSACRAKETLQGKLFGNPRVHICFARNEGGSSGSGRTPLSPHFKSNGHPGASENFRQDRTFGNLTSDSRSPSLISNLDADSDVYGSKRKSMLHPSGSNTFDDWRFGEELRPPPDVYECHGSPRERGSHFDEFSLKLPQKASLYEEPWDLPEESYLFHGAKKLKTGSFLPDKELPEYPFSDLEQEKHAFPRAFSEFPQPEVFDKNYGYKPNSDRPTLPHGERTDHWKASYDNFQPVSATVLSNPGVRKRFSPEPEPSSLRLWKWEGTIAKGGTPVCHARGFPVGKALDIMLPEFLDCTARTGLDMLAKHYYQAASAWVVFFAPASDADIGYYNEFMHYLGEKQRAAVAKLDDKTTLFLVPPSDFSEKVLRVPGKLCISGVVLRLELPGPNLGPIHHPNERRDTNLLSFHGDAPPTPSGHFPSMQSLTELGRSVGDPSLLRDVATSGTPAAFSGSSHAVGRISDSYNESRHDYPIQQRNPMHGPNWSPHHPQISGNRNTPSQGYNTAIDPVSQEHHSAIPRAVQEDALAHYTSGMSSNTLSGNRQSSLQENKPSIPSSLPIAGLQPQQLAQLASSLLGQQRQPGSNPNVSMGEDIRQTNTMNPPENQVRTAQAHGFQNSRMVSDISTSQFGQPLKFQQQQHQASNVPKPVPTAVQREVQSVSSQMQNTSAQEEADGDPQKRLQATLQLAAALLQQIQQGKGT
ncbi:flowering time control protein FPA [Ricinus communis]|uniref:flowering time control protein FPA n=1 Tax=Ricinus communis TaxID=3988 RepID=UPI00201ACF74|nr:flowering time control protein FPA [Ricinus communis]